MTVELFYNICLGVGLGYALLTAVFGTLPYLFAGVAAHPAAGGEHDQEHPEQGGAGRAPLRLSCRDRTP